MVEVFVKKPLYDNFVFIRDIYINEAERSNQKLRIRIPRGERVCTPGEWKRGAKYMEKVFLRPGEPMKLWGNHVPTTDPRQKKLL
jgi:hypothetical protein